MVKYITPSAFAFSPTAIIQVNDKEGISFYVVEDIETRLINQIAKFKIKKWHPIPIIEDNDDDDYPVNNTRIYIPENKMDYAFTESDY